MFQFHCNNPPASPFFDTMNELAQTNATSLYDSSRFALALEQAAMLSKSDLLPKAFQGRPENCLIALELADRMNASPFMVAQNVDVIHGKPTFSAKFLIGTFNSCGRFDPITYEEGPEDGGRCRAISRVRTTGDAVVGPWVSMAMAKAEGWVSKNGSKWQTMPQMMLRYRAATFMVRTTAPELSLGLPTTEEVYDTAGAMGPATVASVEIRDANPSPFARLVTEKTVESEPEKSRIDRVGGLLKKHNLTSKEAMGALLTMGVIDGTKDKFGKMTEAELDAVLASDWSDVAKIAAQLKTAGGEK